MYLIIVQCYMCRIFHQIPSDWGTAVNVQSMVFGNMGKIVLLELFLQETLLMVKKKFMVSI